MTSFTDCCWPDASGIALTVFDQTMYGINCASDLSASMHCHQDYELTFVLRSHCTFVHAGRRVLLMPGDLFFVAAEQPHSCRPQPDSMLYQCHFKITAIPAVLRGLLDEPAVASQSHCVHKHVRDLHAIDAVQSGGEGHMPYKTGGFIHLSHVQAACIQSILEYINKEQTGQQEGFVQMKQTYLSQLLVLLKRIYTEQFEAEEPQSSWKKNMVDSVLRLIDEDLTQDVDFDTIAHMHGITLNYFRTVFKEIVGMTPKDYLNRARILKALELLQATDLSIAEAAAQVGIYDANYFSRLFKKVIGYPPRYFKSIGTL